LPHCSKIAQKNDMLMLLPQKFKALPHQIPLKATSSQIAVEGYG